MKIHRVLASSGVTLAILTLGACSADAELLPRESGIVSPTPAPTETPTVLPAPPGSDPLLSPDPRCVRQYPDSADLIDEGDLTGRPDFWPPVPEWAALCWTEWENDFTQVGWYATDEGISRAEIYRTYEHALIGLGVAGRSKSEDGEIVTGVVPPSHSFWLIAHRDGYRVTWSYDGEYAG